MKPSIILLLFALAIPSAAATIAQLQAEIVRLRTKPVHQRITDLARVHQLARDLAAAGIDPATANPVECAAAIRTAEGFEGKQTGCLGPTVRSELAKDWIAIKTGMHHPCGLNQALDVYQRQPSGQWTKRLGSEESGRGNVITPWVVDDLAWIEMASGIRYVGFTRSRVWCSSTWHPVIFELHALRGDKFEPVVTLERMARITGADPPIRMKLLDGEAIAEFQAIGPGSFDRLVIARYRVNGLRAERVSPIAAAPHHFADEWIEIPQDDAARFSEGAGSADLWQWKKEVESSFTRACEVEPRLWQVVTLLNAKVAEVVDLGNFEYRLRWAPEMKPRPCLGGWLHGGPMLGDASLIDPKLPKPKPPVPED